MLLLVCEERREISGCGSDRERRAAALEVLAAVATATAADVDSAALRLLDT